MNVSPAQKIGKPYRQLPICRRKRFTTREACAAAAKNIGIATGAHRLPETCSKCNGWHLSEVQS